MASLEEQIDELAKKISEQIIGYNLLVILRALEKVKHTTIEMVYRER